jgi:sugar (pentulose or hexulose) kinase
MVVRVMRAGSATWDWACRAAAVKKGPAAIVQAQQSLRDGMPPPVGLVALPWLTQPGPWGLSSGGGILGITTETSRADLLRAIAAGMCFELKAVVAPAIQAGNIDAVVLTGGASRSKYFQRFLAGLLAPTPVYVLKEEFFGCRGAVRAFLHRGNPPRVDRVPGARPSVQTAIDHGYKVYCRTVNSLAAACRREAAGFLEDVAQRSRL